MIWRTLWKRASALALAAALTVTLTLPAGAAEAIGDGVAPTYDEAYYATLDYYGNLLEGSMVKSYALNGRDCLTDYGVYDEVVNLTDSTAPSVGEGSATFRFSGGAPDHFYFEGKTRAPFEDLPWSVTLRYTLNGVPAKAEDLAGKQGVVEILLDILPNENASDYARYNYTLAATALFNQDDILSLEAEGAQVQLVGNLRTVLFLCLPGEEQHFTIRVGSDSFSFGGLTVLMVPATLAQLEEISKLSQRKDDLEEDYRALSGSLDNLLDALADIQNGLYASARGLDQLEAARRTFSGGKGVLYDGTDSLRGDLSSLAELLVPVEQRVQLLSQTVTSSKTVLNDMADAAVTLQGQLAELENALYGLERGTYDLKNVIRLTSDMEDSLLRLENALGGSHTSIGSVSTNSRALVEKVKNVHGAYATADEKEFMLKMLKAQGMGDAQAAAQAASISRLMEAVNSGAVSPDRLPADQQAALAAARQMQALHAAAQSGQMHFQDFCEQLPGVSKDQAKQMNDLWLIYNSGGTSSGRNHAAPPPAAPSVPEVPAPEPPEEEAGQENPPALDQGGLPDEEAPGGTDAGESGITGGDADSGNAGDAPGDAGSDQTQQEKGGLLKGHVSEKTETPAPQPVPEEEGEEVLTASLVTNDPLEGESGGDDESGGGSTESSGEGGGSTGSGSEGGGDSAGGGSEGGGSTGSGGEGGGGSTGSGGEGGGSTESSGEGGGDSTGSGGEGGGGSAGGGGEGGGSTGSGGEGGGDSAGGGSEGGGSTGSGSEGGGDSSASGDGAGKPNDTVGGAVVDLITGGLDSASARIDAIQSQLMSELNSIEYPTSVVVGYLADICGELNGLVDSLDDAEDMMAALRTSSGTLRGILEDADALRTVLNGYEPVLQEALANAGTLASAASATIRDTETLIADAENLARSTGKDLDEGTRQSLAGLSAALRQTARALAATTDVKNAKNTVTDIIEDTWNEYTGDINNMLLMDAAAEPVSLTDSRNPAPASIQVLIRTQEIKEEKAEEDEAAAAEKAPTTFWGRIARMFRDFWNAVTGIFH